MKKKTVTRLKKIGIWIAAVFSAVGCLYLGMSLPIHKTQTPGVTFSRPYVQEFKLDPDEVLAQTLDDLHVRRFRIPTYWSLLEPQRDQYDWFWLDKDLNAIADRGGSVVLAIGQKQPRWPECWIPKWALELPEAEREQAVLNYLQAVISRYKGHPAVKSWQLENEPGFPFGTCPKIRAGFYDEELEFVRSLDDRPIASTDSGELAIWRLGRKVDRLGFSVYRVVVSPIGIWRYWFIPDQFYMRKAQLLGWLWGIKELYISEFQMEPWTKRSTLLETPMGEQMETFDQKQMAQNIRFAKNSGISTIDYWGVEWWYWMKKTQNNPDFWNLAKTIFRP
jgi:hypothetical protein